MDESATTTLREPIAPVQAAVEASAGNQLQRLWRRAHRASPFASNIALTAGTNVALAAIALVTGPICARLLGPAGRGELAAIQNLYWFAGTLGMLGLSEAAPYFSAQQTQKQGNILASAVILALSASPLFIMVMYFLVPLLLAAQSPDIIRTARWCMLGIPIYALATIPISVLRASRSLGRWNFLRLLGPLGWFALLLLVGLVQGWATPRAIAIGYMGVLAAISIPIFAVVRRSVSGGFRPEPGSWSRMLHYGIPLAGASIPITLNLRLDQMAMAALLPAETLGFYVVAVGWSSAVTPPLVAVGTTLFPRIAGADPESRCRLLAQGVRVGLAMGIVLGIVVAMASPWALPLIFGQPFRASVNAALLLVAAAVVSGINVILEEGLRGLGATAAVFRAESAGLVLTSLALITLLKPLGIVGAALASILGYLGTSVVLAATTKRITQLSMSQLFLPNFGELRRMGNRLWAVRLRTTTERAGAAE